MRVAGKVVLITGSNSGIDTEIAIQFSRLGASLSITGRNVENLQKVAEKCTQPVFLVAGDITNESDTKNILESTIKHYGKLDVLVNNAGGAEGGTIETTTLDQFDRVFNLNVRAVYHLTILAVPHLIKTQGNIINVSSIGGLRAVPTSLAYCMAKASIDQFTRCTALELADKQIRVNCVNPGTTETNFFSRMGLNDELVKAHFERGKNTHSLGRIGQAEDIASAIAFLASNAASFVTGVSLPIDGGRHAACPR